MIQLRRKLTLSYVVSRSLAIFGFILKLVFNLFVVVKISCIELFTGWAFLRRKLDGFIVRVFNLAVAFLLISVSCFIESSEAHSAEDKASSEKNRRRFKTPTQLTALENFYNGKDDIESECAFRMRFFFYCL